MDVCRSVQNKSEEVKNVILFVEYSKISKNTNNFIKNVLYNTKNKMCFYQKMFFGIRRVCVEENRMNQKNVEQIRSVQNKSEEIKMLFYLQNILEFQKTQII